MALMPASALLVAVSPVKVVRPKRGPLSFCLGSFLACFSMGISGTSFWAETPHIPANRTRAIAAMTVRFMVRSPSGVLVGLSHVRTMPVGDP